jgi:hypothetical protein
LARTVWSWWSGERGHRAAFHWARCGFKLAAVNPKLITLYCKAAMSLDQLWPADLALQFVHLVVARMRHDGAAGVPVK